MISVTDTDMTCGCNHLTFFGGDYVVAPNTIDFKTVFSKFKTIGDNIAVLLTLCIIIVLYWIALLLLRRKDKSDLERVRCVSIK